MFYAFWSSSHSLLWGCAPTMEWNSRPGLACPFLQRSNACLKTQAPQVPKGCLYFTQWSILCSSTTIKQGGLAQWTKWSMTLKLYKNVNVGSSEVLYDTYVWSYIQFSISSTDCVQKVKAERVKREVGQEVKPFIKTSALLWWLFIKLFNSSSKETFHLK